MWNINENQEKQLYKMGLQNFRIENNFDGTIKLSSDYIIRTELSLKDFCQKKIAELVLDNHLISRVAERTEQWRKEMGLPIPIFC